MPKPSSNTKGRGGARPGAGRKPSGLDIGKRSLSIPTAWEQWLIKEAEARNVHVSDLVKEALQAHFNLEDPPLSGYMPNDTE